VKFVIHIIQVDEFPGGVSFCTFLSIKKQTQQDISPLSRQLPTTTFPLWDFI